MLLGVEHHEVGHDCHEDFAEGIEYRYWSVSFRGIVSWLSWLA